MPLAQACRKRLGHISVSKTINIAGSSRRKVRRTIQSWSKGRNNTASATIDRLVIALPVSVKVEIMIFFSGCLSFNSRVNSAAVVVLKRSMASGFAGIDNPLFYDPKTSLLFQGLLAAPRTTYLIDLYPYLEQETTFRLWDPYVRIGTSDGYGGVIVRDGYAGYGHLTSALHEQTGWLVVPLAVPVLRPGDQRPRPDRRARRR